MSLEGRINVDVLFHDKDGTASLKVVSLQSTTEYPAGAVAIVTGTAGTAQKTIEIDNVYVDASGQPVQFATPQRIAFSWSGINARSLQSVDDSNVVDMLLRSRAGQAAVSNPTNAYNLSLRSGSGTGTYTIVVYGE
jgi:hypothetical protein